MMCDASRHSDNVLYVPRSVTDELDLSTVASEWEAYGGFLRIRPIDDEARELLIEAAADDPPPYEPADYYE